MEPITSENILKTGMAFWASRTLLVAVEMGLFSEPAGRPMDAAAVQSKLGLHQRGTRDFLDALVAMGFLTRTDGIYRNAPDADLFLDRAKPSYIGGILEMASRRLYGFWNQLPAALRTGTRQNESKDGTDEWAILYADADRLKSFLGAMTGISHAANCAIAGQFPWANYKRMEWMRGAGFSKMRVEQLEGPDAMVVGIK